MDDFNDIEEPGFWERHRVLLGLGAVVLIVTALGLTAFLLSGKPSKPKPPAEIAVHLLPPPVPPPPPPPPPPPKIPPPPEQKMVEQPPVKPDEVKPKNDPKPDKPPGPPGPAANGPPSDFGLGGPGGGGDGSGAGGGGGSRFGYYANQVTATISDAIRKNDKTRHARAHVKVRLWVDGSGRVTQVKLAASSDEPGVDSALQNEVLAGLTLPQPPPSDMPMPIVLLLNEARPN